MITKQSSFSIHYICTDEINVSLADFTFVFVFFLIGPGVRGGGGQVKINKTNVKAVLPLWIEFSVLSASDT